MRLKNKIKKIIDVIKDTDINEIEISSFWGAQKIKLKKGNDCDSKSNLNTYIQSENNINTEKKIVEKPPISDPVIERELAVVEEEDLSSIIIKAPLVGTFYLSPKPGEPPFIEENKKVNKGDTLCIIEAMKIFNEIESEQNCIIKQILVSDGEPIEYDQPLFKVEEI